MNPIQTMPLACPECSAQMPETAAFCPGCGRAMQAASPPQQGDSRVGAFPENIAGALAYLTVIPAMVFLLVAPYKKNRFVRFHSAQCILLSAATLLLGLAVRLVDLVVVHIPVLGPLAIVLLWVVLVLGVTILWLVLVVKALQGEPFAVPVLGNLAELYADFH